MQTIGVDTRPHRIEGTEPFEESVIGGKPAGDPLIEVVVCVDQPGCEQTAAAIHTFDAGQCLPRVLLTGVQYRGDQVALDDHGRTVELTTVAIHGGHENVLDQRNWTHRRELPVTLGLRT